MEKLRVKEQGGKIVLVREDGTVLDTGKKFKTPAFAQDYVKMLNAELRRGRGPKRLATLRKKKRQHGALPWDPDVWVLDQARQFRTMVKGGRS